MSGLDDAILNLADALGYPAGAYFLGDGGDRLIPTVAVDGPMAATWQQARMVYLHDSAGSLYLAVLDDSAGIIYEDRPEIARLKSPVETEIRNGVLYVTRVTAAGKVALGGANPAEVVRQAQQFLSTKQIRSLFIRPTEPISRSVQTILDDRVFFVDPRTRQLRLTNPDTVDLDTEIAALGTDEHRLVLITYNPENPDDPLTKTLGAIKTSASGLPNIEDFQPTDYEAFSLKDGHIPGAFIYIYENMGGVDEPQMCRAYDPRAMLNPHVGQPISPDELPDSSNAADDEFDGVALASAWSWINQGGATATLAKGLLCLSIPSESAGDRLRGIVKTAPSTPYIITAKVHKNSRPDAAGGPALLLRNSSSGKLLSMHLHQTSAGTSLDISEWTDESTPDTAIAAITHYMTTLYMRIENDGTDVNFSISQDGVNFVEVATTTLAAHINAADQIGVGFYSDDAGVSASFDYFRVT